MKLNHNKKSVKISLNLFALYAVMVCGIVFALPAFAASDPLVVVENLSTFIFSLIRAVGLILLGWGIGAGRSVVAEPRPQPAQPRFPDAGGWSGDYLRQRNPRPHYRVRVLHKETAVMPCG